MAIIYLIRHAETLDNSSKKYSGATDCELSEKGINQIKKLSLEMKKKDYKVVYTSPLKRAINTAKSFTSEFIKCDSLKEIDFGDFEQKKFKDIESRYPNEINKMISYGFEYRYPKGESLIDFHSRVSNCFNEILKNNINNNIVIVAHGGTIRCILSEIISNTYKNHWNFQIDNCSISKITYIDSFAVINYMNNINHLR